jgi:hypothetical protein
VVLVSILTCCGMLSTSSEASLCIRKEDEDGAATVMYVSASMIACSCSIMACSCTWSVAAEQHREIQGQGDQVMEFM